MPDFIFDLIEGLAITYLRTGLVGAQYEKAFQCAMDCLIYGLKKQPAEA